MNWIFTVVLVLSLESGFAQDCVSQQKIDTVNNAIDMIYSKIQEEYTISPENLPAILKMICFNNTVRQHVNTIESEIGGCPELAADSRANVSQLNFGQLTFLDLLKKFTSVDNFCNCVDELVMAMTLQLYKTAMQYTMPGAKYPYAMNPNALCNEIPALPNMTVAMHVLASKFETCSAVYDYVDLINKDNVILMKTFVDNRCNNVSNANFTCAMNASSSSEFKYCIDQVPGNNDKDSRCKRDGCVSHYIQNTCSGDSGNYYMMLINMRQKDTFYLLCTSGSTTVVFSFYVLLMTISVSFLHLF